jgi:geranylgeranyl diphosphate synthase type II
MDAGERIERSLESAVSRAEVESAPPKLAAAIRYAVFPGGARVRPRLAIAVAEACAKGEAEVADAAAASIELLHCASLVHDDLPCFDNSDLRRGRPSVHAIHGAPLALLAGDAMIVMAFETLGQIAVVAPQHIAPLLKLISQGVGAPHGIVAGQAWESEPNPPPEQYRCAKTGALFVAATMCGAVAGGGDPNAWRALGLRLGEAYQVADDLMDAVSSAADGGKPVGQDAALGRPNAVAQLGINGAVERLQALIGGAIEAIPSCRGEGELRELVKMQALRLAPKQLLRSAA